MAKVQKGMIFIQILCRMVVWL